MCPAQFAERLDRAHEDTAAPRSEQVAATPLVVGAADDRAELEADRVAGEVIGRLHAADGHAHSADCGHADVRRVAAPPADAEVGVEGGELSVDLSSRIESRRGAGAALSGQVRTRLEQGFGGSLANVRVHTDGESAALNRAVAARAFTAGTDIFFGAGEYRPGTPEGEHMLAHEVAHTRQQGADARRTPIRRWDIWAPHIPWNTTTSVTTIKSGQAVFILDDGADKLVVKSESAPIGLAQLSTVMHKSLSDVKSVEHRKLEQGDKDTLVPLITDATSTVRDPVSWGALGKAKRTTGWVISDLEEKLGKTKGDGIDDVADDEVGRYFQEQQLIQLAGSPFMAMTHAEGTRAEEASSEQYGMLPEDTRMRAMMNDWGHLMNLGQLTAVDLFMNNHDRVFMGNVGNWFYDPDKATMTVIDHVDAHVPTAFEGLQKDTDMAQSLHYLAKKELGATALEALQGLCVGVEGKGGDKGFTEWLKEDDGYRWDTALAGLEKGLEKGRNLIIKTFSVTKRTIGKDSKTARETKKSIKAASQEAERIDNADPGSYYKILKARATWVKKH